ncbi:MAG: MFS transporter [Actinomycetota bacterium]|nr:MFS transporter [Actinomycetota bacterium]
MSRLPLAGGTFRSLRVPNYRLFFAGHAVSVAGTWMQRVAQDWLVLELTDSGVALGIATALQFLPTLLLGMWGGLLADRYDKRHLIIATQVAQAVLAGVLGLLAVTGLVELWMVYVLALLLGIVTVVDSPTRHAFSAELVPPDDYVNAQGLNGTIHNAGRLVGPAIAGVLIATVGVGPAFLINAVSFAAVIAALLRMDPAQLHREPADPKSPHQVREGLVYVWDRPVLRFTIVVVAIVGLFGQNLRVVLPLLASRTFGQGAQAYGWLMAMVGLGAIAGALVSASRTRTSPATLLWSCGAFGVVTVVAAAAPTLPLALAAMVLLGFCNISVNTVARTLLQLTAERRVHGRVMALHALVSIGSTPFGGFLSGWVGDHFGARQALAMGGIAALGVAAAYLPRLGRLETGAAVDTVGVAP